jgi:hypothetical protein
MRTMKRLAPAAALILAFAGTAGAATLNEWDVPGGAFGSAWNAPTAIGAGITTINGTGAGNQYDNFAFTALPAGAQTLTMTFSAPPGSGWSYAAGGTILWSTQPFRWGWDGTTLSNVFVGFFTPSRTISLTLPASFGSTLYLALNFTFGTNLGYTIDVPSNAVAVPPSPQAPTPVPLPAGAALLAAALAALGVGARRARRA